MTNIFLAADLHFGHRRIVDKEGGFKGVRPFDSVEEMDEALVANWNSVVRPQDKAYILGDCVINRRCLPTLGRLNGDKILVKGNHDMFRLEEFTPYFRDIRGSMEMAGYVMTHIPIHPMELKRNGGRWKGNIHGHLHSEEVMLESNDSRCSDVFIDPYYLCVSMEQINYTPISLEAVKKIMEERHG